MGFQIAMDGPAGAGKSSVAKTVAKKLGFVYVDTGAMYRAFGLYLTRNGIDIADADKIENVCKEVDISISYEGDEQVVYLNGENVNGLIRTEEVGNMASACGTVSAIRKKLVELQQKMAENMDVVMEGRDICTSVLPNAQVKIYLTATIGERAKRRYKQLLKRGIPCDIETIKKDVATRDYQDMNRDISPLKKADDATFIDTTDLKFDEVVNIIVTAASSHREVKA